MRKVVLLEHVSLDGFVAGPRGEMNWIRADTELFELTEALTVDADAAIYGRVTYELMAGYWPTAADGPNATQHDISHARWVNSVPKLVFSRTLDAAPWGQGQAQLIKDDVAAVMPAIKEQPGQNLLMIGSAGLAQDFMRHGLIDEFRLFVNPVILGAGKRLFPEMESRVELELVESKPLASGVLALHYQRR